MPLLREFRADFRRGRTGKGLRVRSDTEIYQLSVRDSDNMMILPNGSIRRRWGTYIRQTLPEKSRIVEWIGAGVKHNFLIRFTAGNARFELLKTVAQANAAVPDFVDLAETVAGPWTADTLWLMQVTPTRDGFIVTDNSFAPRIYSYDPDKALGSRWTTKIMSQRSLPGGRRRAIPFVVFDPDAVFTPRVHMSKDAPDAYSTHIATAFGWTKGAYPANDLDGANGTGKCTVDRDYFKASHVGTRFRWGDGEFEVQEVTTARQAKIRVTRDLAVKLDLNPFFLRKGSKSVEVAWPEHGLEAGQACFFFGIEAEPTQPAQALLTKIPQVVTAGASTGTSAVVTAPAAKYTVKRVVDENHFEIDGAGTAPTVTGLYGGASVFAIPDKGMDGVKEAIMGPARGYPQAACIHENRLWLGGFPEWPDVAMGSVPFTLDNFDTGEGGPADAVLLMGVGNKSQIRHLTSFRDLLIFHDKGVHYVPSPRDAGVSQETARALPAAEFGSAYTSPVLLDGGVFYVERDGKHIREFMRPEEEGQVMTSPPTTIVVTDWVKRPYEAQNYIGGGDESMAYAFFVQEDGSVLVMHSSRHDQSFGFMRWSLANGALFESVSAVGDRLFAAVKRGDQRFLVEFDTWSFDAIGMDLVEVRRDGTPDRYWNTLHHRGLKGIQLTIGEAPGRYHYRWEAKATKADGSFRTAGPEGEVRIGQKMPFLCAMHPVVAQTAAGVQAGAKTRLVSMDVHWETTTTGSVHGWQVAENPSDIDTEFDKPMRVDGWRNYPIGEWGEEAFARIEGDEPGRMGIRAVSMKVYL